MFKFPLWIAQSKEKIIIYDANFKIVHETNYSLEEDQRLKQLVHLTNQYQDLSFLDSI